MSTLECKVVQLKILEHPNADALELAQVGDYVSIVRKGTYQTGDIAIYIPEQSVLPNYLIERMGLTGRLAGKQQNRLKPMKLRGIFSQGLCHPLENGMLQNETETIGPLKIGEDVKEFLGIKKYEPEIPSSMSGEVWNASGYTLKYDIENFKKFPEVIEDGTMVVMAEKIHGTFCCWGYHPKAEQQIVNSKGLGAKGLAFALNEKNQTNVYIQALQNTTNTEGKNAIDRLRDHLQDSQQAVYILGEVFGKGIQDLAYSSDKEKSFRVFDIYLGSPGQGRYADHEELTNLCKAIGLARVPILYHGPFSKEAMLQHTSGKETVSGQEKHIREGVVIRPAKEQTHPELGRVQLKSVSEKYLLRNGGTEYN